MKADFEWVEDYPEFAGGDTEREAEEADGAHNPDLEGSTPSPATNPQPDSEDAASDEDCDCYERVHVEESPGRWIDKRVKRGGCCG